MLEHGKPHERSAIVKQLTGQIVQMSQQKFASNVVEKCLTFGTPTERQILVNEMLGSTDENEPLQVCESSTIPITEGLKPLRYMFSSFIVLLLCVCFFFQLIL